MVSIDIQKRVAIVTGASSGIGLATARLLTAKGARVALVSRSKDTLERISKELPSSLALPADITKENTIRRMVEQTKEHFGRIDILINNAGQGYDAPIEKTNITTFRYIFELDVVGQLIAMQEVIPIMRSQGGGSIMNVSSGTALMYLPNMGAYSSAKRALVGISLTAREELKRDNIVVSVVYPYITLTNFQENTMTDSVGEWEGGGSYHPADTAEYVAQKILEGVESGEAEIFAHDWMREL
ncbi:MAG: SDR family oxidoreductase [Theionarchaea archaeon]|nr:SDR family oxidoreductase [Theionarchaea archaeon]